MKATAPTISSLARRYANRASESSISAHSLPGQSARQRDIAHTAAAPASSRGGLGSLGDCPYPQAPLMEASSEIVVMKFGGTSVASPEDIRRAAGRIVAARARGARVVAVLSARGKTTDE